MFHPASMFVPTTVLILLGIGVTAFPQLVSAIRRSAFSFTDQRAYTPIVLHSAQPARTEVTSFEYVTASNLRGLISLALSLALALGTVFRDWLGRAFGFTRSLELGSKRLRGIHSGHPGDYVAWLCFATAVLGLVFVLSR